MANVKMGVVGVGHMGQYHANILATLPNVTFVGVYDVDRGRCSAVGAKYGVTTFDALESLLQAVDAVCVAVPTNLHYSVARQVLDAGVHLLLEKPIARTVRFAEQLVNIALRKNLVFQIGHIERFNGAIQQIKNIIDSPYLVEARRLAPFSPRIKDVGVVLDMMIHDIDIVTNLLGYDVKSVDAVGSSVMSPYEDIATAHLLYENGCVVDVSASRVTPNKIRTLAVSQRDAYIFLDYSTQNINIYRQLSSDYSVRQEEIRHSVESTVEQVMIHNVNPLQQEISHFVGCVSGSEAPSVDGEDDIRTLRLAKKIIEKINLNAIDYAVAQD